MFAHPAVCDSIRHHLLGDSYMLHNIQSAHKVLINTRDTKAVSSWHA